MRYFVSKLIIHFEFRPKLSCAFLHSLVLSCVPLRLLLYSLALSATLERVEYVPVFIRGDRNLKMLELFSDSCSRLARDELLNLTPLKSILRLRAPFGTKKIVFYCFQSVSRDKLEMQEERKLFFFCGHFSYYIKLSRVIVLKKRQ